MGDLSTTLILLAVNAYVLLALSLFALSTSDLVCRLKQSIRCAKRRRKIKIIVAVPLMLSCLALLGIGLFVIGMSHGSRPKDYQVWLFILGCLAPFFLFIFWIVGSLLVDALWVAIITALIVYLSFVNPAIYISCWADDNYQWAQLWIARHYKAGDGGLHKSDSMARVWYKKAAVNGNPEAQYKIAQTERRAKNALKWYLLAAEQGHVDAMVQAARLARNKDDRQVWLDRAASHRHSEALFMMSQDAMTTDLPTARQLMLESARNGSRSAIVSLITQYQEGGILFDQNNESANKWRSVLENTPPSDTEAKHLTTVRIDQTLKQAQDMGGETSLNESVTLYKKAQFFLHHPAKDQILHDRAIEYLVRAANKGHGEAALELAKLAMKNSHTNKPDEEALKWYEIAAINDNRDALKQLTEYYKEKPDANVADLKRSIEFNERLLNVLEAGSNSRQRFQQQHWSAEYRDSQKKLAQLKRLGGSWQEAIRQAEESPQKEYQLAKELIDSRQYTTGMQRMKSAAQRGNPQARYELARRTLNGSRSFTQEVDAISELQALDQLGLLAASVRLGSLYQSGTGVVPKNLYLARLLFRKAQADVDLSKKALRLLKVSPGFTDSLQLDTDDNPVQKIKAWYDQAVT
jgi:TPR repeat protein